jgi:hypothetical protein
MKELIDFLDILKFVDIYQNQFFEFRESTSKWVYIGDDNWWVSIPDSKNHPIHRVLVDVKQEDKMCARIYMDVRGITNSNACTSEVEKRWTRSGVSDSCLCIGAFRKETMWRMSGACVKYSRPTYCSTSFARPESQSCAQAPGITDQKGLQIEMVWSCTLQPTTTSQTLWKWSIL